jgi:pyruvate dehydrogenase E2 component (dihydrolipoamide acetyltransferase)
MSPSVLPTAAMAPLERQGHRASVSGGGMLVVRPVLRAALAADHRVVNGHDGARFLSAIDRLLQHPEEL